MRQSYTKEVLEEAAKVSTSVSSLMRYLGISNTHGQKHAWISKKLTEYEIDISHFTGRSSGLLAVGARNKKPKEDILILRTSGTRCKSYLLRRALLESGKEYKCEVCNISTWQEKSLDLEVDHKNGNHLDDRLENLRFICPNCHSQTNNYKNKKRN